VLNFFIFVLILVINIFFELFFKDLVLSNKERIIIERGMSISEVSDLLKNNNIIKHKLAFRIWIKVNFTETKIKFGEYEFEKEISVNKIVRKLKNGDFFFRKFTIVEGTTKFDLLKKIKEIYPDQKIYMSELSDYFVADTYHYNITEHSNKLIENISKSSSEVSNKFWSQRDLELPLRNIEDLFILSSIVEKETSLDYEKSKVAGVFYNRLKKGMRLQSDPTVIFSITEGKTKFNRKLLRKDLKYKSSYNTYLNKGLPPSPICFPGIKSMEATVNPDKNEYFYFVADPKINGHIFSRHYHEHLKNIKKIKEYKIND
jgi:UPF0755 protein